MSLLQGPGEKQCCLEFQCVGVMCTMWAYYVLCRHSCEWRAEIIQNVLGDRSTGLSCLIGCASKEKGENKENTPFLQHFSGEDCGVINWHTNYQLNLFPGWWYLPKVGTSQLATLQT